MKLAIFGATGGVGRNLMNQALEAGHEVTVLTRDADRLHRPDKRLTVLEGDVRDPAAVARVVEGQDAVLVALGAPLMDNSGIREAGTRTVVDAMKAAGVQRLICLSVFGAGESWAQLPRLYRWVIMPLVLRRVLKDHVAQEAIIRASGLDWSLARPGNFTDGALTGNYWHGAELPERKLSMKISRADVADYMLRQLGQAGASGRAEAISY